MIILVHVSVSSCVGLCVFWREQPVSPAVGLCVLTAYKQVLKWESSSALK